MITRDHLKAPSKVNLLWQHALDRGYVQFHHRVNFFVTAIAVAENLQIGNPGGKFTAQVRESVSSGNWLGNNDQELRAQRAIAKLKQQFVEETP